MRLKSSRDHELVLEWKITTNKENKYERWSKIKVKNKLSQRKINYIAKAISWHQTPWLAKRSVSSFSLPWTLLKQVWSEQAKLTTSSTRIYQPPRHKKVPTGPADSTHMIPLTIIYCLIRIMKLTKPQDCFKYSYSCFVHALRRKIAKQILSLMWCGATCHYLWTCQPIFSFYLTFLADPKWMR